MKVNNVASWAREKPYMVIRIVDGEAWFYDGWDDVEKAISQAIEEDGMVIPTSAADPE